jgi:chromosomal replication initiation ATPase DnaA
MLNPIGSAQPIQFSNTIRAAICAVAGAAAIAMVVQKVVESVFEKRKLNQTLNGALTAFIGSTLFLILLPLKLESGLVVVAAPVYVLVSRFLIPALAKTLFPHPESDKLVNPITFKNIAGNPNAKAAMETFVEYVKSFNQPESVNKKHGIKLKGMLFYGPPGTGKTLFAQALAGETGCPFVNMRCSELNDLYVGSGTKKARELFDRAKELAIEAKKPCILFIDEVDAIGMKRSDSSKHHPHDTQTLASLLTRVGAPGYADVFVIMATNRKEVLDEALIRSGRIDEHVEFQLPNKSERIEILKVHLKSLNCEANDPVLCEIAEQVKGFSGADLANIIERAIILAAKRGEPIGLLLADFTGPIAAIKTKLASSHQAQEPVPQITANNPMASQVANQFIVSLLQFLSQYQNPEVGNSSIPVPPQSHPRKSN